MAENKAKILNGPYLLAPAADAMTVVWEMLVPDAAQLQFWQSNTDKTKICTAVDCEKEQPCPNYPQGSYLYQAHLQGLREKTTYFYEIQQQGKVLAQGSFQTLSQQSEKLHLLTISDSHLLHLGKEFTQMSAEEKPDFILHGGDISFGTGFQQEQYEKNWFHNIPDLLKKTPIFYVTGNHDDGPFFLNYFTKPQAKVLHTSPDGHSFSLDYGIAHITMVDSNSWGLFEMNAQNSGVTLDTAMQKRLEETLAWVQADLASEAARKASWRILVMHHPYTDVYNNEHIVPIAEAGHVDLILGGHLHYYIKAVSVNPDIGAKSVYITQGSLQDPAVGLDKGQPDKRLLEEFPEAVAMGQNNYGVLDIQADALDYALYGFDSAGERHLVDRVHLLHEEPELQIEQAELRRLDNNGNVEVRARVRNDGHSLAEVVLPLKDNGETHLLNLFGNKKENRVVVLEPGEEQTVTAIYQAIQQGKHELQLATAKLEIVVFEPNELAFSYMKVFAGKGKQANQLIATIEATNNLEHEIFAHVPLYINQRVAEDKSLFFRAHERKQLKFVYVFQQAGDYQVSIADQLPKDVHIDGGIRIVPRILDRSGHQHNVMLRGTPKVFERKDGIMDVRLEKPGDYIEIEPSEDLQTPQGFTGMVWAKVNRLAHADEMGHSPLIVRGQSIGWGANYCLRIALDRTGSMKWSICHDITEYQWQGGEANVGDWAQYTLSFDKERGGTSLINGNIVAQVQGVGNEAKLRQWADRPIFIGYSYIGHLIPEIGRPKYYTTLNADISQVRFYTQGLSVKNSQSVYAMPEEKGSDAKNLAVWLDFRHILSVGTHTTEWRHPSVYAKDFLAEKKYWQFKQLKAKTVLPFRTNIRITVQVSDDQTAIKDSMDVLLQDGTNYIDLSRLAKAQYLRIITNMSAEVGAEGTFIPELLEYQVTAEREDVFTDFYWSTLPDWQRGTMTGAIGFYPSDRLREYPEYTDIIHG